MGAIMPLPVARLDFLSLWANETLLAPDSAIVYAAVLSEVGWGRWQGILLVRRVVADSAVVEGILAVAALGGLEGDVAAGVRLGLRGRAFGVLLVLLSDILVSCIFGVQCRGPR